MLDWLTDVAVATTKYIGLLSGTATDDAGGGLTEVSTGAYARQSMGASGADWAAAAQGATGVPSSVANGVAKTFPQATADYAAGANITYFGLYSALTAGTLVAFGALTTPKPVLNGDTASFAIGALVLKLGDPADTPY
jgi:hypothetical protein